MYQRINFSAFMDAFTGKGRLTQFSYRAMKAIFDYLEGLEDDTGEAIELDVVAICCEFSEYENLEAFRLDYPGEYASLEDVEYYTTVIPINDESFVIACF